MAEPAERMAIGVTAGRTSRLRDQAGAGRRGSGCVLRQQHSPERSEGAAPYNVTTCTAQGGGRLGRVSSGLRGCDSVCLPSVWVGKDSRPLPEKEAAGYNNYIYK